MNEFSWKNAIKMKMRKYIKSNYTYINIMKKLVNKYINTIKMREVELKMKYF